MTDGEKIFKVFMGYNENVAEIDLDAVLPLLEGFREIRPKCSFCWHWGDGVCSGFYGVEGDNGSKTEPDHSCLNFKCGTMNTITERLADRFDAEVQKEYEKKKEA